MKRRMLAVLMSLVVTVTMTPTVSFAGPEEAEPVVVEAADAPASDEVSVDEPEADMSEVNTYAQTPKVAEEDKTDYGKVSIKMGNETVLAQGAATSSNASSPVKTTAKMAYNNGTAVNLTGIEIYYNGKELTSDTDYDSNITCSNNKGVTDTALAVITFKNGYLSESTLQINYSIVPSDLKTAELTFGIKGKSSDGAFTPINTAKVTEANRNMLDGTNIEVPYDEKAAADSAGVMPYAYEIKLEDGESGTVIDAGNYTVTGINNHSVTTASSARPTLQITFKEGTLYEALGTFNITYTIVAKDLAAAEDVLVTYDQSGNKEPSETPAAREFDYTGTAQEPDNIAVTIVNDGKNYSLTEGVDYELVRPASSGTIDAGTNYKIQVKGLGNYTGISTKGIEYKIKSAQVKQSDISVPSHLDIYQDQGTTNQTAIGNAIKSAMTDNKKVGDDKSVRDGDFAIGFGTESAPDSDLTSTDAAKNPHKYYVTMAAGTADTDHNYFDANKDNTSKVKWEGTYTVHAATEATPMETVWNQAKTAAASGLKPEYTGADLFGDDSKGVVKAIKDAFEAVKTGYKNNIDVASPNGAIIDCAKNPYTVIIKGKGDWANQPEIEVPVNVQPKNMLTASGSLKSDFEVTVNQMKHYDGTIDANPTVTIKDTANTGADGKTVGGTELKSPEDYTWEAVDFTNPSTADQGYKQKVKITGTGNYTTKKNDKAAVYEANVTKVGVDLSDEDNVVAYIKTKETATDGNGLDLVYTGQAITVAPANIYVAEKIDGKEVVIKSTDYEISGSSSFTTAGKQTIKIKGTSTASSAGTVQEEVRDIEFTIAGTDINEDYAVVEGSVEAQPVKTELTTLPVPKVNKKATATAAEKEAWSGNFEYAYSYTDANGEEKEVEPDRSNHITFPEVGTYTITVTPKNSVAAMAKYSGEMTTTFQVKGKDFSDKNKNLTITKPVASILWPGHTVTAADLGIKIVDGGTELKEDTDYTVAIEGGDAVGTAKVTLTGIGDYEGTIAFADPVTINKMNMSNSKIGIEVENQPYCDGEIKLLEGDITVTNGKEEMAFGVDYDVTCTAGTADAKTGEVPVSVTVTGKGNYEGTKTKTNAFRILATADIANDAFQVTGLEQGYNATTKALDLAAITLVDSRTGSVVDSANYDVTSTDEYKVGDVKVTITAKADSKNYTGTRTETVKVTKPALAKIEVAKATYTGSAVKPEVTVYDSNDLVVPAAEYKLTWDNNVKAGTASVVATAKGENYTGFAEADFTIAKASVAKATVKASNKAYTGKTITPSVTVKVGKKTLKKGTDYTVTTASKSVGQKTVTIKGKGNYTGSKKVKFYVVPAKGKVSKATAGKKKVAVKVSAGGAKKFQIRYRISGTKKWTTKSISRTSYTISKLKKGKKYQIQVRGYDSKNKKYGAWSAVKTSGKVK